MLAEFDERQQDLTKRSVEFLEDSNNARAPAERPSLCVMQGEQATVSTRHLPGCLVGSQDATTCVIAILACPATGVVWVAHLDSQIGEKDATYISSALAQMQQPQLFLVGGYCDARGAGPRLVHNVLQHLHSLPPPVIQLRLCCTGQDNTQPDGSPTTRQLLLDTATWTPRPWLFPDRGPELPRRFAAQHCRWDRRSMLLNVWDQHQQQLRLQPFDPSCLGSWEIMAYEQRLAGCSDVELLQVMSTSPQHEPDWFAQDMRGMMRFLVAAQDPHSPERRAASSVRRYQLQGNAWQQVPDAAAGDGGVCTIDARLALPVVLGPT